MKKITVFCITLIISITFLFVLSACNLFYHIPGQKHENNETANYTVTFQTNGGTVVEAFTGQIIEVSPQTTKEGSIFKGWYLTSDFSGSSVTFPFTISENCTLYAKWLEIGTDGFVYSFDESTQTYIITGYEGNGSDLVIPCQREGYAVEGVADGAFKNNTLIKNVTFQEGVKKIGDEAFSGCSQLSTLILNEGLEYIGNSAFKNCLLISNIEIPVSVLSIGQGALSGLSSLNSISMPFSGARSTPETDEENLFGYIFGTESYENAIEITQSINGKDYTYFIPNKLKSVTVYTGSVFINSFYGIKNIPTFIIEGGSVISDYAFYNAQDIETVSVASVTNIGISAFENSEIKELKNTNNVKVLGENAFKNCQNLSSLNFSSLTEIGNYAFSGLSGINNKFILSGSVTSIGEGVFEGCTFPIEWNSTLTTLGKALKGYVGESFTVPSQITALNAGEFENCTALINFQADTEITAFGQDSFKNYKGASLTVPANVVTITNAFSGAECDISFETGRTSCVRLVGQGAFANGGIPNEASATNGSENRKSQINFNGEMNLILGEEAFKDSYYEINWGGATISSIGLNCFNGYKAECLVFDKGTEFTDSVFSGYLGNIDFNNANDQDGYIFASGAFNGYGSTDSVIELNFNAQFSENAFSGCNATVIIAKNSYQLSTRMFNGFSGKLILKNDTLLGEKTFENSDAEIIWEEESFSFVYTISTNSFYGFKGSLTFPTGNYTVKSSAFENANLISLNFKNGSSISVIEGGAFKNCGFSVLENGTENVAAQNVININLSEATIKTGAFEGCSADLIFTGLASEIETQAFLNYKGHKLCLPEINTLGVNILYGATDIEEIEFESFKENTLLGDYFGGTAGELTYTATQRKDVSSLDGETFAAILPLSLTKVTVKSGTLSAGVFSDCVSVTDLIIDYGVTVLEGALFNARGLVNLTLPYLSGFDTKHFASYLFTSLAENSDNINIISDIAYGTGTISFTFPKNLNTITLDLNYAVDGQDIYIQNETFVSLPIKYFYLLTPKGIQNGTDISISLGKDVFRNCTNLQTLVIGETVKSIGIEKNQDATNPDQEFSGPANPGILYGCWALTDLTVPYLGPKALIVNNPEYLNYYNLGYLFGEVVSVGTDIEGVTVTNINGYNFYIPDSLIKVKVDFGRYATSVTTKLIIYDSAFANCSNIQSIVFKGFIGELRSKVFAGTNLNSIEFGLDSDFTVKGNNHFQGCQASSCVVYISSGNLINLLNDSSASLTGEGDFAWGISTVYSFRAEWYTGAKEEVKNMFESVESDTNYQFKYINITSTEQ